MQSINIKNSVKTGDAAAPFGAATVSWLSAETAGIVEICTVTSLDAV